MSACWRCGSSSPSGANFCPSCGAELRSELPDLDLLTEPARVENTAPVEADDTATSPWLIAAAVAVVGGFVAFFALVGGDSGDDFPPVDPFEERSDFDAVAVPTTEDPTTETEAANDATDVAPLDWSVTRTFGAGAPLRIIEVAGSTFLYTVDPGTLAAGGVASRTYERTRTGSWADRGPMLHPAATVNTVASSDRGAIAAGMDEAGVPTVWRSNDGITWAAEPLPVVGELGPDAVQPRFVAEANGIIVVAGAAPNPWERIEAAVEEQFGEAAAHATPEVRSDSPAVTVRGPFGLVIGEIRLADLGLDALDLSTYFERPSPVWERTDAGEWTTATADGVVLNLFATDDGQLVRNDGTNFGSTVTFRTADGWTEPVEPGRLWRVEPWGDQLVGRDERRGLSVLSPDLTASRHLPVPSSHGHVSFMTATDEALAVARVEVDPGHDDKERVVVLRDGFTLTAEAGILTLSRDDEVFLRGSLHWEQSRERYQIEKGGDRTVVFLDDDGAPLVGFTIDELASLQAATDSVWTNEHTLSVFVSRDGERWTGGEIDDPAVDAVDRGSLHLQPDRIIAALQRDPSASTVLDGGGGFIVIEAELPD